MDGKNEALSKPFRGGGTASADSSTFRGQSQSQLQGSFQYGITYNGAAQAGSGSGATSLRKPFNFSRNNSDPFKSLKSFETPQSTNAPESNFKRHVSDGKVATFQEEQSSFASNDDDQGTLFHISEKLHFCRSQKLMENIYCTIFSRIVALFSHGWRHVNFYCLFPMNSL